MTIDEDAKSALVAGAKKELAYLDHFGSSRAPYQRFRREYYNYEKQPPSDHAQNLRRYLRLAPWLVPEDDSLSTFCIRHPDVTDSNVTISKDSSDLKSLVCWTGSTLLSYPSSFMPVCRTSSRTKRTRSLEV